MSQENIIINLRRCGKVGRCSISGTEDNNTRGTHIIIESDTAPTIKFHLTLSTQLFFNDLFFLCKLEMLLIPTYRKKFKNTLENSSTFAIFFDFMKFYL